MHHFFKKSIYSLLVLSMSVSAQATPTETTTAVITRTAQSGLGLQSQLTKNTYRQEAYQANYTVQVPYQTTESYTVDVPYEDTEAYQDLETYYENEYICRDYTEYERRCSTRRECNFGTTFDIAEVVNRPGRPGGPGGPPGGGPGPRPEPRPRPEPGPRPDPGPRPGPRPEPGPRPRPEPGPRPRPEPGPRPEPPRPGPGPRPEPPRPRPEPPRPRPEPPRPPVCRDVQECRNVPVNRQRCGYEQVARTRWVTKYRTVTRYRQETRTREVTRYRTEERCCETLYRTVFDRQWALNVNVQFPQGTELQAGEVETFELELGGTEAAPDVVIKPSKTIFGYAVASKTIANGTATIVLQQVPRYKAADLQQSSIKNLQVVPNQAGGLTYKFQDNAIYPRVSSNYQLKVEDAATGAILAETPVTSIVQRDNSAALAIEWDFTKAYNVVMKIQRAGSVIENGGVAFEIRQPITLKLDMDALKSEDKITAKVVGDEAASQLIMRDDTINYSSVVTEYTISIARRASNGDRIYIGEKLFSRTGLTAAADGSYVLPVSDIVKTADLKYIKKDTRLVVTVAVKRQTHDGKKISFKKDNRIHVE